MALMWWMPSSPFMSKPATQGIPAFVPAVTHGALSASNGSGRVNDDHSERFSSAKSGDVRAFEELLAPLADPGFRLAMTMLNDRGAAEDAVQESALNAWRHLGQFRSGSSLRPLFRSIIANECRTVRRARWWQVQRLAEIVRRPERDDRWADRMD